MCGIAGILANGGPPGLDADVATMLATLVHRGPDDSGQWVDGDAGIALGQRRLAIIDLSPQGHQPMRSASGRYVLVYNGEIYNFQALRDELQAGGRAPAWRGHSDTEVLLAAVEAWGIETTLRRLVGMFAIALWDRDLRQLVLARDRLGEKPLYYGVVAGRLLFASELKALRALGGGRLEVDRDALAEFMRFGYVPAPATIYRGVRKLMPGHWLRIDASLAGSDAMPTPFWSLEEAAGSMRAQMAAADDRELVDRLERQLTEAIGLQMVSDVPLGAFLSGGVDSSAVVALMQKQSRQPVRTFTIGFAEPAFDEAPFARDVARHLGTAHTELYVTGKDAEDLIPRLPTVYDEPFADASQIPTTLVSHLTRRHVTVSLSGDGGDELFAGYPRYGTTVELWRRLERLPLALRRTAAAMLAAPAPRTWDGLLSVLPASRRQSVNGRRLHRLARLLSSRSLGETYMRLITQWQPEDAIVPSAAGPKGLRHWDDEADAEDALRLWDARQYLPDDLLVKVDRAAMSASLEARAPLLDHRVVELAFALPRRVLVRGGQRKWALRQVLYRHVPQALIDRPKTGFAPPLGAWLRGPLRDWAAELIRPAGGAPDDGLDNLQIAELWDDHVSGRVDRSPYLWNALMYRAWLASVGGGG